MELGQRRIGRFVITFMRAYGISCGGATRCIIAAPTASPKTRCSANWVYCRFVEPSWNLVRESAVKSVGKPDAGNPHVRFDERGWETGRRFGVSARAHPRLYKLPTRRRTPGPFSDIAVSREVRVDTPRLAHCISAE